MKSNSPVENAAALNSDLFTIERADGTYILYAPLNRVSGIINRSGVNTISKFLAGEPLAGSENLS